MQPDPSTPQHDPSTPPADSYAPPATDPYVPPATDPYARPVDPYAPPATPDSRQPYPPPPVNPHAMPTPPSPPPPNPYAVPTTPPYPGPYGGVQMHPNAGYPFPAGKQNTLGLLSMILGIASVPLACCFLGLPVGIAAVVTGWLGQQKVEQGLADNRGQALAGIICGAIGALLGLGWVVLEVVGRAL
ncbi:DUF4190 domain-containing protein [Salinispora mooreana]|uniref:DUF4190 domain-containing protein n=1 Tax=Salinispora mooreana TaxID=999545 RepID=UPI00036CC82B|nr:DUF4190 domain-containing protein [Salinispora mooreana]